MARQLANHEPQQEVSRDNYVIEMIQCLRRPVSFCGCLWGRWVDPHGMCRPLGLILPLSGSLRLLESKVGQLFAKTFQWVASPGGDAAVEFVLGVQEWISTRQHESGRRFTSE
jgi:hypothetical protein